MAKVKDIVIEEAAFKKILTNMVMLPLFMAVGSAVLFMGMIYYINTISNWAQHTNSVIVQANQPLALINDMELGKRSYLLSGNTLSLDPFYKARATFRTEMKELIKLVEDKPVHVQRMKRIEELYNEWAAYADKMIQLRQTGKDYLAEFMSGRSKHLGDAIRAEMGDFLAEERALRKERLKAYDETSLNVALMVLLLSLLSGSVSAYFARRRMLEVSSSYNSALMSQLEQQKILEHQNWLQTGRGALGDAISGEKTQRELCEAALATVARQLQASAGAIYLVNSNDHSLECLASYGLSLRDMEARKRLGRGETLAGQIAIENRLMLLEKVPENYLHVSSGLGEAQPRSLLIAPISEREQVLGVMEFGFLHTASAHECEFMEAVSEMISMALQSALFKEQLQHALEESQTLNEELQTQQEELKSANEELEQQSSALRESQIQLESQREELVQTNSYLQRQTQELTRQKNALDDRNTALANTRIELEQKALEVERASRYKSEFLANMSHELRTPLNSALILSRLLADNAKGNLTTEQVHYSESIYSAGNDLLMLINDVLDLSKVEAGMLKVQAAPTPVSNLLSSIRQTFEPVAAEKKLAFEVRLADGLPESIMVDDQRLLQILKNLLSNAFKFTEQGSVSLSVQPSGSHSISFGVTDTGMGISKEDHESIFEAFHQAEGVASRNIGGTGLGLSISKNLATLLGGTIALQSEPGQGSTFTLTIPLAFDMEAAPSTEMEQPVATVHAAPASSTLSKTAADVDQNPTPSFNDDRGNIEGRRTVLVIEDDTAFCSALYDLAHDYGFSCLVAQSADEGISMARKYAPDAILLDMKLPDLSGMAVLERLKSDPDTRHIPVHVVSALDRSQVALHMGAVGYLMKPAEKEQIKETFAKLESKLSQGIKRVLVVEDDKLQRESIRDLIAAQGIEITLAARAEEALAALKETIFDCMIVDLNLPDMRGHDLLEKMSQSEIVSFPPVIVYTGKVLTPEEENQLRRYSSSIIIKGARSPERLLDEVTLFLHQVEALMPLAHRKMLQQARSYDRDFEGRKVLLVDDDIRNVFALNSALELKGLDVRIGRNGFEALAALEKEPDIDLVLMDIMMPEMDGFEAMKAIRKQKRFEKLPIIAVTAKAMPLDQSRCLEAGASDYIAKPLVLDRLFSLIRVWLTNQRRW